MIPNPKNISIEKGRFYSGGKNVQKIQNDALPPEGYILNITERDITVSASTKKGFFYADKTLGQLNFLYEKLPVMRIDDEPEYAYRSFMLDVSRHFFDKEYVKKLIKTIASFKMNKLHLHLTDDQGWRIEIEKYPLLTEVGGKRAGTRGDNVPHSGYFTKADIKEILKCGEENFVEVIPEVDFPGHFAAAIAAYPNLSCDGEKINVREYFGISPFIACAGKEKTLEFMKDVLREIAELFPSKYFHLGGDEASKAKWLKCPDCQKKMEKLGIKDEDSLQTYVFNELSDYLRGLGKTVICWNDGFSGGKIDENVILQHWKEDSSAKKITREELNKGRKIIASPFFKYYLDYPHGMTSLKKTYGYLPDKDFKNHAGQILGVECPLWTEFVATEKRADFMSFPRAFAVAERGWGADSNFYGFLTRLIKLYPFITALGAEPAGINDAMPPFMKGKADVLKFFKNAVEKEAVQYGKLYAKSKKAVEKKKNGK